MSHYKMLFLLFFVFLSCSAFAVKKPAYPVIGIIIPLSEESDYLQKNIKNKQDLMIDGIHYSLGTINNKHIVFVNSGMGKINSAIVAARLIRDFHPSIILMSGSSGNLNTHLKKFDVVIGREVSNVDLGILTKNGPELKSHHILPMTFKLNDRFDKLISKFNDDLSEKVTFGKIATSDALPNPPQQVKLLREANFDVIEMEGASLMQACWLFNIPCVVIRGVSNGMFVPIDEKDVKMAADKASKILIEVISTYSE